MGNSTWHVESDDNRSHWRRQTRDSPPLGIKEYRSDEIYAHLYKWIDTIINDDLDAIATMYYWEGHMARTEILEVICTLYEDLQKEGNVSLKHQSRHGTDLANSDPLEASQRPRPTPKRPPQSHIFSPSHLHHEPRLHSRRNGTKQGNQQSQLRPVQSRFPNRVPGAKNRKRPAQTQSLENTIQNAIRSAQSASNDYEACPLQGMVALFFRHHVGSSTYIGRISASIARAS